MSPFLHVDESTFNDRVLKSDLPVLVEFSAPWCRPCKNIEPVVEALSEECAGQVALAKVNVEESPILVQRYQVMCVPTLILFNAGAAGSRLTGGQSRERIAALFPPRKP